MTEPSSPRVAEAWARTHDLLERSLGRREASAWSVAVRLGQAPVGQLLLGHARAWRLAEQAPGPLLPLAVPEPLTAAHVFDWASLTKVVGGQLLFMQLVAAGRLSVAERVAALAPELGAPPTLCVDHLLRYTSGWPAWRPLYALRSGDGRLPASAPEVAELLRALPCEAAPGARRLYSDLGHIALGYLLERVTGERLSDRFAAHVATPLGLVRTGYLPAKRLAAPAVATSHGNAYERRMLSEADFGLPAARKGAGYAFAHFRNGPIVGEVDDGNAHYLLGGVSAHAGLFGPSEELATLAEALVLWGAGAQALGLTPAVQAQFASLDAAGHLPSWWHGHELGLRELVPGAPQAAAPALMMRGFCGTMVYVEPARSLVVAMVSNREHVDGHGNYPNLRPVLHDVVALWRAV